MNNQDKIKEMYFEKKYNQKEIASILGISNQYVSKVLLKDEKYRLEKINRKKLNEINHKKQTINYIKRKRAQSSQNDYNIMKQMHIQASKELSGASNNISNRAFKKWNSSIYNYDKKLKCYKLNKNIVTGFDVPKKINWKIF